MANEKSRDLTAEGVCRIIKAAKEAGVRKLSFRGLEVDFGMAVPMWPEAQAFQDLTHPVPAGAAPNEDPVFIKQELSAKADRLAESVIDDPELYEDLLARNELVRKATDGVVD